MNRILVMDPNSGIRLLYAMELADEGYEVIMCDDASGLIELIGRERPDLVIMEVMLGKLNGLDILQEIRTAYGELPVVFCTTWYHFKHDRRSAGAQGYVVKSSELKELKDIIQGVLAGKTPCPSPLPYGADLDGLMVH